MEEQRMAAAIVNDMVGWLGDFKALLIKEGGDLDSPTNSAYIKGMERMIRVAQTRVYILTGLNLTGLPVANLPKAKIK